VYTAEVSNHKEKQQLNQTATLVNTKSNRGDQQVDQQDLLIWQISHNDEGDLGVDANTAINKQNTPVQQENKYRVYSNNFVKTIQTASYLTNAWRSSQGQGNTAGIVRGNRVSIKQDDTIADKQLEEDLQTRILYFVSYITNQEFWLLFLFQDSFSLGILFLFTKWYKNNIQTRHINMPDIYF
jgi:hypothetical protein